MVAKLTLPYLICQPPLGFCCVPAFFAANQRVRTALLAARLGLDTRTVRLWRARWRCGMLDCNQAQSCVLKACPPHLLSRLRQRMLLASGPAMVGGTGKVLVCITKGGK